MLLIHQSGAVKVGEVVRYTLTYTPLNDRILPSPTHLHVKIKNTSAIPLRAAYLHGPYTLHVAAYPSTFNPNLKLENGEKYGYPDFEPNLKAAGQWTSKLTVPEDIRSAGGKVNTELNEDGSPRSVTWIIEIASQIIFSNTASVHFELLIGRDERSLDMGFAAVAGKGHGEPGKVHDFHGNRSGGDEKRHHHPKGVYSKAVHLTVEDTVALWNKPALPKWEGQDQPTQTVKTEGDDLKSGATDEQTRPDDQSKGTSRKEKQKKLHLVILTHGLHSNVGADLLYLKESIDATAKAAREDARKRKATLRKSNASKKRSSPSSKNDSQSSRDRNDEPSSTAPLSGGQNEISDHEEDEDNLDDSDDDEEVIVRGFSGNAVKTERGIQYLGKRLAKFILTTTFPVQPYLPASKSTSRSFSIGGPKKDSSTTSSHPGSSVHKAAVSSETLPYTFTKISFIGHSLGGLIQTYAIGYIHKHSPEFFKQIKPENFIAMAAPFLGLSNENPIYVKFALDFGLVGRTGRDLGLTWRAPTIARSGWSAMVAGLGPAEKQNKPKEEDPRTKPLLRILPTGPARQILKMFTNRTVYSNVVNDGIVPLRTSCLLFLDWRGLDRVENARRENGLITTMAQFGWNELTGSNAANVKSHRPTSARAEDDTPQPSSPRVNSPEPFSPEDTQEQDFASSKSGYDNSTDPLERTTDQLRQDARPSDAETVVAMPSEMNNTASKSPSRSPADAEGPFSDFLKFFRPSTPKADSPKQAKLSAKTSKTFRRAQTIRSIDGSSFDIDQSNDRQQSPGTHRPSAIRGESFEAPPPKTTFFEAAGDILNPPIPSTTWLIDPSSRSRSIFHDRIYRAEDIPPPPPKRPFRGRSFSNEGPRRNSTGSTTSRSSSVDATTSGGMKIEEKIARAYHHELSWRKVLVRLQPDAHNNMIVRRMFANAYGWDVVKHLCDTHFGDTYAKVTNDDEEPTGDRVENVKNKVTEDAEEVEGQTSKLPPYSSSHKQDRTDSEVQESTDNVHELKSMASGSGSLASMSSMRTWEREDSVAWDDAVFEGGEDADDSDEESEGPFAQFHKYWSFAPKDATKEGRSVSHGHLAVRTEGFEGGSKSKEPKIADEITNSPIPLDSHRGLAATDQEVLNAGADEDAKIDAVTAEEARPDRLADEGRTESIKSTEVGLGKSVEEQIGVRSPELLTGNSDKK